ncbi:hypothetical protein ACEPAG_3140 [Sanghuangporus baumii]
MAQPTPEVAYCAFSTARAYAAQHRNYGNCQECKKAHQKCNGSDGAACDRCIKLKKECSLLDTTGPVRSPMEAHDGQLTSPRYLIMSHDMPGDKMADAAAQTFYS